MFNNWRDKNKLISLLKQFMFSFVIFYKLYKDLYTFFQQNEQL